MSTSTDALHFYGVCLPDDPDDDGENAWPWDADPARFPCIQRDASGDCRTPEGEYTTAEDAVVAAAGLAGVILVETHCSRAYPMGIIAIEPTFRRAWRGYPVRLPDAPPDDATLEQWRTSLRAFCAFVGYDFDQLARDGRVGWWLCSDTDLGG